jgi:iron complex outermembrane receptor protein
MNFKRSTISRSILAVTLAASMGANAAEMEEVVVQGDLGSLPGEAVKSVFGMNKSLLETPRSASTISEEMMERFNMGDIDELVAVAPGSFTQSFFGVAGGLDVRGTPGETYFRGVRRLDNPGNYPTPIGASDRVDVVRGPASPIFGPSKIGGYLNFNPKSARVEAEGQYIYESTGQMSFTTGNWDKSVLTAEVGGPGKIGDQEFGYYLYGELEDSGSFYRNGAVDQTLVQASFDMDISPKMQLQFGGMYHDYDGNQNAGWNRLTQELIDDGIYVTGSPAPLDTSNDGSISHQEYLAAPTNINPFLFFTQPAVDTRTFAELQAQYDGIYDFSGMALLNPGRVKLDRDDTLIAADDTLENEVLTLYFDVIYTTDSDWEITNQMFYEEYENLNENAYGFSQFHDTWVFENKLVASKIFQMDGLEAYVQLSPSLRYTDWLHGDDFTNEYFDRRDLTGPSTALDRRLLATRIGRDFDNYDSGDSLNWGLAGMVDFTWDMGLSILLGYRYDWIDLDGKFDADRTLSTTDTTFTAQDDVGGDSWNVSVSYQFADGMFIPYVTASEQSTVIAGQGAEVGAGSIQSDSAFDTSELLEFGVKGSLLDNALYYAISVYEQERTDFSAQSIVTNQTSNSEGAEIEVRWVVNENLLLTFGYSNIEVNNLSTEAAGGRFSFLGAENFPNIAPEAFFGGAPIATVTSDITRRAGMPENIFSFTGTYDFGNGWAVSGSVVDVDEVFSGYTQVVELPAYTLLNLGVSYETENWSVNVTGKNLTDEEYFRSNFPNLFGSAIVLPELPRHYQAKFSYKF